MDQPNPLSATVTGTGAIISGDGSVNISGVHQGPIYLGGAAGPARSAYLEQVEQIAPPELVGREDELAEFTRFCTAPEGAPAYTWWRAPAWSGKSALMSWFVLHPPPGVKVVSFFVTAQFFAQSDRRHFLDTMLQQLAAFLGQPMPALEDNRSKEQWFHKLLEGTAASCRTSGNRLILLVDGLDEDRGFVADGHMHSIAATLPAQPTHGLRVVVAGRMHPPVPQDVVAHHPLRDSAIVRILSASDRAIVIRDAVTRELTILLEDDGIGHQVLGLVVTAGGGLSVRDLVELTGASPFKVKKVLQGRTFTGRPGRWEPETRFPVFVLAHKELQLTAREELGPIAMAPFRERLDAWADEYLQRGWPESTPEYLLSGYFRMLYSAGDVPRMAIIAANSARADRILDRSGGDAHALNEISTVQDGILRRDVPDLTSMLALAITRTCLVRRNRRIPVDLPAVWARVGSLNRAEVIAHSISDESERQVAYQKLAIVLAECRHFDRAEALIVALTDPSRRAQVEIVLVRALVAAGDLDRAAAAVRTISDDWLREQATVPLVEALVEVGEVDRAGSIARFFPAVRESFHKNHALARFAGVLVKAGHLDHATTIARSLHKRSHQAMAWAPIVAALARTGAFDQAEAISASYGGLETVVPLIEALVAAGDLDRAETIARSVSPPHERDSALSRLARTLTAAGYFDRAEAVIRNNSTPKLQVEAMVYLADRLLAAGDRARARNCAGQAYAVARTLTPRKRHGPGLEEVASFLKTMVRMSRTFTDVGDRGRAESCARRAQALVASLGNEFYSDEVLNRLAQEWVAAGDLNRAESITRSASYRAQALGQLTGALASAGHLDHADTVADSITEAFEQAKALIWLSEALAEAGHVGEAELRMQRAEAVLRAIRDPYLHIRALVRLGEAYVVAGDHDRAQAYARQAEGIVDSVAGLYERRTAFRRLVALWRVAGDPEHATACAQKIETILDPAVSRHDRERASAVLSRTLAEDGGLDADELIAQEFWGPHHNRVSRNSQWRSCRPGSRQ